MIEFETEGESSESEYTKADATWCADRISEMFPLTSLAYSILVNTPSHKLTFEELHSKILNFPNGPNSAAIYLTKDDAEKFGFCFSNTFDEAIRNYIKLTVDEIKLVLSYQPHIFNVINNYIKLTNQPIIDYDKTLKQYRYMHRKLSEEEFIQKLKSQLFLGYFHTYKLDHSVIRCPESPLLDYLLTLEAPPTSEQALFILFCYCGCTEMTISNACETCARVTLIIDGQKQSLVNYIDEDIVESVKRTNCFHRVGNEIVLSYPKLYFRTDIQVSVYQYIPTDTPLVIPIPVKIRGNNLIEEGSTTEIELDVKNQFFPIIMEFKESISKKYVNFTPRDVFLWVSSYYLIYNHSTALTPEETNQLSKTIELFFDRYAEIDELVRYERSRIAIDPIVKDGFPCEIGFENNMLSDLPFDISDIYNDNWQLNNSIDDPINIPYKLKREED